MRALLWLLRKILIPLIRSNKGYKDPLGRAAYSTITVPVFPALR